MELTTLAMLVVIVGVASYLQTLTGFAFALVFMSAIAVTQAVDIEDGAVIVTVLMLVNAVLILVSERRFVSRAALARIIPPALCGTIAGALLLPFLIASSETWLKFALGVAVIVSSLRLLRIPRDEGAPPHPFAFPLSGLAGGLMGGLFAVPGPPIVYVLQRHLCDQREIRATLVATFAAISLTRLGPSSLSVAPTADLVFSTLMLVPAAMVFTEIARRWPPPLSAATMRALTVLLLILTGLFLAVPPVAGLFG